MNKVYQTRRTRKVTPAMPGTPVQSSPPPSSPKFVSFERSGADSQLHLTGLTGQEPLPFGRAGTNSPQPPPNLEQGFIQIETARFGSCSPFAVKRKKVATDD
jgi:hypothetical protein